MTATARTLLAVAAALAVAVACGSPPPPPPPPPEAPPPAPPPVRAEPAARAFTGRLPNGMGLSVSEARDGELAQIQLGFLVGAAFVAPGLAELAAEAVLQGADASRGRPSLEQAIAGLGGMVQVVVGPLTTWIGIRVPPARWQQAQAALRRALDAPPLPRSQLERIRDGLVAQRCAAITADPGRMMAATLLLAEPDTTAHLSSLLDRDASEIGLFQARLLRPERALLALHVPGDPAAVGAALLGGKGDTLAGWQPPALAAPEPRLLARTHQSGWYWSPDAARGTCEVVWLQLLPSLANPDAADLYTLHACCTLDGAGGRLEQLQRERGLGQVRWRSEFLHGADNFALLLRTEVAAADVPRLWQVLQAARSSLRAVPPNASELELARRRAALTAGLGLLDSLTRQRTQALLAVLGSNTAAFDRRLAQLAEPAALDLAAATAAYLALPTMLIVVGGTIPPDTPDVRQFTLLPPGLQPDREAEPTPTQAGATPWIDRASEAAGGAGLLRRLTGYRGEARLRGHQAPPATETVSWQIDGALHRIRQILGAEIETKLVGNVWTERLGQQQVTLTAGDVGVLRRELERHPLALLAACCRGTLAFQTVAQRHVGDRDYMVLQASTDRFDRLRIHIDTSSCLVRVVEVWETMPDGTTVHLRDAWSDYRSVGGLRAPFRRVTTQDDGQNSIETSFTSWQPLLSPP
jgi:hypothetical protein